MIQDFAKFILKISHTFKNWIFEVYHRGFDLFFFGLLLTKPKRPDLNRIVFSYLITLKSKLNYY